MLEKLADRILQALNGANLLIALLTFAIAAAFWYIIGAKTKRDRRKLFIQISVALACLLFGAFVIYIRYAVSVRSVTFPEGSIGILVLGITGDNNSHDLQHALVASLNNQLANESETNRIIVHALENSEPDEANQGLSLAHYHARRLGEEFHARLVLWGVQAGANRFYPRLTVVKTPSVVLPKEHTLAVQNISELSLPTELVRKPVCLTHIILGNLSCQRHEYLEALREFEQAAQYTTPASYETRVLRYFIGKCHLELADGQLDEQQHLSTAIESLNFAAKEFKDSNERTNWAKTQIDLSTAYINFRSGTRAENLRLAVSALEAALEVFSRDGDTETWGIVQCNLSAAYLNMTGIDTTNALTASRLIQTALQACTEKSFPQVWATLQHNLGVAYILAPTTSPDDNCKKAIDCECLALKVFTEHEFPSPWASVKANLGVALTHKESPNRIQNLRQAVSEFECALRCHPRDKFPTYWADIQHNLGNAYARLASALRQPEYLKEAITAYQKALEVFTQKDFPEEWAMVQQSLKETNH
jgi:tetratricopeptide (TPR) repeat protein